MIIIIIFCYPPSTEIVGVYFSNNLAKSVTYSCTLMETKQERKVDDSREVVGAEVVV